MNKEEAKKYYMNMNIPFEMLKKPENKVEKSFYIDRKLLHWSIMYEDGFSSDSFDEDLSVEY